MTVPEVTTGRGAWSKIAKDNQSRYYRYIKDLPLDGRLKDKDVNYQAVNLGVKAIQSRINVLGYLPRLTEDGVLGGKSTDAIRWVQRSLNVADDGVIGPTTSKMLWRPIIIKNALDLTVPGRHLYGFMALESNFDPGAVGYSTPSDRGLNQINLKAHPTITVEQAFDPNFSIKYTAERLKAAREQFLGKGPDLQTKCSIAQHNSPRNAVIWYDTGNPPTDQIRLYVERVLAEAAKF